MAGCHLDTRQRLRLRALSKYYCVTSPSPVCDATESLRSNPTANDYAHDTPFIPMAPRLARDPNLTALAQLAALRLNCQRSFISVIDDRLQHVVAEATRSVSLYDQNHHDPGDGIVLGVQSMPRSHGVCPSTLGAFLGEEDLKFEGTGNSASESAVVIQDLLAEKLTSGAPVLQMLPPILRYYVEVPLRTDEGHLIGSICVVDPSVRLPGPDDVARLQETAKLVVEHLELVRMREDHRRAERLLEGLAHFVQGKESLSLWSQTAPGQEDISSAYPEPTGLSSQSLRAKTAYSATSFSSTTTRDDSESTPNVTTPPTSIQPASTVADLSSVSSEIVTGYDSSPESELTSDPRSATLASVSTKKAFSRASNLIREGMDLDTTCFLEVPQNERFKNVNSRRPKAGSGSGSANMSGSSPGDSELSTDSASESAPKNGNENGLDRNEATPSPPVDEVLCHRLGYSTRTRSSLANSSTTQRFLTIPAPLLNSLTSEYPEGHIFHFDSMGGISSGDDNRLSPGRRGKRGSVKRKVSEELHQAFPSARSLIFFPLYDNDKQHVYAGFLGWTTDPVRALQKNEIVYVAGFANSIMCEVMRIEAIATDRAKSNFISSISHELRSPLHGILAAGDLLSEAKIYPHQAEFLQMIDTCARTLLDIMDHLLDHAKINHFTQQQKEHKSKPKRKGVKRLQSGSYSLVSKVDLLSVVEETATSVATGGRPSLRQGGRSASGVVPSNAANGPSELREIASVPVIVDILPHKLWHFDTEAGSWRRIITNLVGNSLKYTQHGHVRVSLRVVEPSTSEKTGARHLAELSITDTGQGISEEYLKHRLYTPFAQEDNLSVGTGLGLSLVHQIVSSLHGQIEVQSEVGTGTQIVIRIPLRASEMPATRPCGDPLTELTVLTNGLGIRFSGFDEQPSIFESPTGILDPRTKVLLAMKDSLSSIAVDWFGLRLTAAGPDITVVEETFLQPRLAQYDHSENNLLVVGLDGRASTTDHLRHANFVYMLPPIGPHRMAQALRALLEARKVMPVEGTDKRSGAPAAHPSSVSSAQSTSNGVLPSRPHVASPSPLTASGTERPSLAESDRRPVRPALARSTSSTETVASRGGDTPSVSLTSLPSLVEPRREAALLVDDNAINLRILVACVAGLGNIDHITATNGKEALEKYQAAFESRVRISVVFMDISMPIMDGFQSTRAIRAYEATMGVTRRNRSRIVALTGLASAEAEHEIDKCGFDVYLRKPVTPKTVKETLAAERQERMREDHRNGT